MHLRSLIASAASLAVLSLAAPALCTEPVATTADTATGYIYTFKDDPLAAGGPSVTDVRIHVVAHAARDVLIRPRVNFIPQLLKSVENL